MRVNALYVCHDDAWGQTGGITIVDAEIFSVSARQKIKTKSSTETELVVVIDNLPYAL